MGTVVGFLLEPVPGDSKLGPKLYCCYRIYNKTPNELNPETFQLEFEMYTNNRDLDERGYLPHPGWASCWQLCGKLM